MGNKIKNAFKEMDKTRTHGKDVTSENAASVKRDDLHNYYNLLSMVDKSDKMSMQDGYHSYSRYFTTISETIRKYVEDVKKDKNNKITGFSNKGGLIYKYETSDGRYVGMDSQGGQRVLGHIVSPDLKNRVDQLLSSVENRNSIRYYEYMLEPIDMSFIKAIKKDMKSADQQEYSLAALITALSLCVYNTAKDEYRLKAAEYILSLNAIGTAEDGNKSNNFKMLNSVIGDTRKSKSNGNNIFTRMQDINGRSGGEMLYHVLAESLTPTQEMQSNNINGNATSIVDIKTKPEILQNMVSNALNGNKNKNTTVDMDIINPKNILANAIAKFAAHGTIPGVDQTEKFQKLAAQTYRLQEAYIYCLAIEKARDNEKFKSRFGEYFDVPVVRDTTLFDAVHKAITDLSIADLPTGNLSINADNLESIKNGFSSYKYKTFIALGMYRNNLSTPFLAFHINRYYNMAGSEFFNGYFLSEKEEKNYGKR